ncbi:FAD-dependent monooxygenase [Paracoccaceae bacterium Fryx2]|nr:FAD-dependent monooxygenase [Paracoccaceae bacterium Fryx2]
MATGPTHDVIVVGAGPAGSAAARTAGLSVALIDKARFPRDKLCGGAVSGRGLRHLREVFGAGIPADMALTVRRVRIMAGERLLGELDHVTPLHLVMRHVFDAFLRDQAVAAGAEDFCGQRILSLDLDAGRVELAAGTLQGRVVIGADGAASPVARALHGRAFHPDRIGFALEVEVPQPTPTRCWNWT